MTKSKEYPREPKKEPEDALFKQRQSFMATRVNLQQMHSQSQAASSLSTFYGLGSEKPKERVQSMIVPKKEVPEPVKEKKSEAFGVLLPNLDSKTYKRYERQQSK